MSKPDRKTSHSGDDEVEQMLREAQDDLILKLNVGSHMARASSAIDLELDRRFQALKNSLKPTNAGVSDKQQPPSKTDVSAENRDGAPTSDDLLARFLALKKYPACSSTSENLTKGMESGEGNEDEVEKVIRWAIDAARLDPFPPDHEDGFQSVDSAAGKAARGSKR